MAGLALLAVLLLIGFAHGMATAPSTSKGGEIAMLVLALVGLVMVAVPAVIWMIRLLRWLF